MQFCVKRFILNHRIRRDEGAGFRGAGAEGATRAGRSRFFTRRLPAAALMALLAVTAVFLLARTAETAPVHHRHVLIISVDGMRSAAYMNPPSGARIPTLLRLKRQGSFAEGVEGVYPTVTYASHTTLVTGCLPAQDGIYTNLSSRVAGKNPDDWFWFSRSIKCTTLWDEAREHGLTSGSVGWPVTAGAAIDWDVPEIWNPQEGQVPDPLYVAKFMNPVFALQALGATGKPKPGEDDDELRTRLAVYVIQEHKPDLMLVHLVDLDNTEHHYGPRSAQAAQTLEHCDERIGEILTAFQKAGMARDTDVFIVSDHGFLTVDRVIHPNTLLVRAGLLQADARGNITGGKIDTVSNGGSFFIYWPPHENFRPAVERALKPLFDQDMVWGVLGHHALKELGADPNAQLALEAPRGAMFDRAATGPLVSTRPVGGSHGYLPFRKGLESSFIAWGPDIKPGVDLHRIRMTSIAPTILKAMGVTDPKFGRDKALVGVWRRPRPLRVRRHK